ncbi:unnamed protein product [Mytilus coruscus]|uniref:Dynamin N-terminal domain-containing protein n=1 Tax=Mytilus coruscus TaxID=42192 RepID=A0A6J8E8V6_MYTCO|nr:unnamed protein product [Mytilus coruscus]
MIFILLTTTVIAAFELKCPDELDRTFRARHVCYNITDHYSCLLDQDTNVYKESCADNADYVRPGQKYVTSGRRKNTDCSTLKYQPFKFWSHRLSQCVFKKSMCGELGQILNGNGSSMADSTCRCDYTAGFAFVTEPRDKCFCRPTEEDCMCYIVSCPTNMPLNQDYNCSSREDSSLLFSCPLINKTAVESDASSVLKGEEKILTRILWAQLSVTCLSLVAIILLTIMAVMEFRYFPKTDTRKECRNESQKEKISPEIAVEKLRFIIELLEKLLSNKEFDKDFQEELSAACPNYMNVLQTYKRDLLRNDCGILIAGETSAGKTTLINQLVGKDIFFTSNLAATGTVCRIRNSNSLSVQIHSKDHPIIEKAAADFHELASLLKQYTDIESNPPEMIDVYLPVPILQGNVIIVDTPGVGENEQLDNLLLDFLPHAVSFVFIVNASNAGGIHKDRLLLILKTVIEKRKEMPCFEPDEVIFLTNQWDIIKNIKKDGEEEDTHTRTWNQIQRKLEEGWPGFKTDRLFKISLEQVRKRKKTPFTRQFERFMFMLSETIERNKNKRVEYYFRFVQRFAVTAELGIASRIHLLEISDDDRKKTILKNKETVRHLEKVSNQKMMEAKLYKTKVITKLAQQLTNYLKSNDGRTEILNPPGRKCINSVGNMKFGEELITRINMGINRWCEGDDVLMIIQEIHNEMKNLLSEVQLIIQNIEHDITGFARSIHDVSFTVFTRSALRVTMMRNRISLIEVIRELLFLPNVLRSNSKTVKETRAIEMYDKWLSTFTYEQIQSSFEENFGTEYDKVIFRIFKREIPQKIDFYECTIRKLLIELSRNKKRSKSFTELNALVHNIKTKIEEFIGVAEM